MAENSIIKKISLNGTHYEINAVSADNVPASGIIGEITAKIDKESITAINPSAISEVPSSAITAVPVSAVTGVAESAISSVASDAITAVPADAISEVPVSAVTGVAESAISSVASDAITAVPASAIKEVPTSAITGIAESAISSVAWSAVSAITGAIDVDTTSGLAEASAVAKAINDKIATVYKVKGTLTAVVIDGKITNMPDDAENGDVWNIALPEGTSSATLNGQTITNGDNVVFVKSGESDGAWDKLAGAVDTTTFATKEWTNSTISAAISAATSAEAPALWSNVTGYVDNTVTAVSTSSTLWNTAYDYVTANSANIETASGFANVWSQTSADLIASATSGAAASAAIEGAVATSADMANADNVAKLAQVGAITGYIEDKISETIAETIDIASEITIATAPSAIPNVGAVTSKLDEYVKKTDIKYNAADQELLFDFTVETV